MLDRKEYNTYNHYNDSPFKNETTTFSLVFLTWNAGEAILQTLESIEKQSFTDYEIVIVDNNSQDDTLALLRDSYSDDDSVRIFENERNLGFSRGINRGIRESDGQYICCYNHDTIFPDEYLQTLAERITPDTVWTTARRNYRVSSEQTTVRLLSRYRFSVPYVVDSLSGVAEVNYVPGDGVIVPREIYRDVLSEQVFDPAMPLRVEDVDLSMRLDESDVPMRAILDTHSIHPDNSDMYALTAQNFLNLLKMIPARATVHRKNTGSLSAIAIAAGSLITNPLIVYGTDYPRSATAFADATSVS